MTQDNKTNPKSQVFSTLVKRSYLKTGFAIESYEHGIRFIDEYNRKEYHRKIVAKRGNVNTFSRSSRSRMLRLFSQVQQHKLSIPLFVTFTYHYNFESSPRKCQTDLNNFLQNLRNNYPDINYIWRLELQKRGAPHFHLILWDLPKQTRIVSAIFHKYLAELWHRIAEPESHAHKKYGCFCEVLHNYKKAFSYCSKYVAKEAEKMETSYTGRRWGKSTMLPLSPNVTTELPFVVYQMIRKIIARYLTIRKNISSEFYMALEGECSLYIFIEPEVYERIFLSAVRIYLKKENNYCDFYLYASRLLKEK